MKKISILLVLLSIFQILSAIELDDIIAGKYKSEKIPEFRSMQDGEHYTQIFQNKAVAKYNYSTGNFVDTLFSVTSVKGVVLKSIDGYILSPDEQKMLVYNNVKYRYRRSFTADYYIVDLKRKEIAPLSEFTPQEAPLFSPNSRYIAFAHENNLHIYKFDFKTEIQITKDGQKGKIINGISDWVYEEEFETTRHFEWSPDSKLIAFNKFREEDVPEFSFQTFSDGNEQFDYPKLKSFKYPKAGNVNSKVDVCIYNDFDKTTRSISLPQILNGSYIPRIKWTNSAEQLAVFQLNREQNQLNMYFVNPRTTNAQLILRQEDKRYIDYSLIDDIEYLQDGKSFILTSEKDGYNHLYQYSMNGRLIKQLTKGKWDITKFYGFDSKSGNYYYQSATVNPTKRELYKLSANGKTTKLSFGDGISDAIFSKNFKYRLETNTELNIPEKTEIKDLTGKVNRVISSNSELKNIVLELPKKEMFSFRTSENIVLNGWILKPKNFNENQKYPVLQVQYSGPGSQQALDKWSIGWEYYLAENNCIVVCVDGRGTGARGSEFKKCTYQQMGLLERNDQIETAKYLASLSFIDKDKIGIWGWSYGGSTTLWSMSSGEKIFKAGIAVAPVTDWHFYNTAYTERFMRRPQENSTGYSNTSALNMAEKLEGRLLLIHGTADDNVHVQNTYLYTQKLVEAGKQFEMHIYTDKEHSLTGLTTRTHLYRRMYEFLQKNLF